MATLGSGALQVGLGVGKLFVGDQRHLGIHDQVAVLGQVDHHIGVGPRAVVTQVVFLYVVFDAGVQTREFEHAFQNQLAPIALGLGSTFQGLREVFGVLAQRLVQAHELVHLLRQGGTLLAFGVENNSTLPWNSCRRARKGSSN